MAAVPSLSEPQRSGDSHPAVSHLVQKLVEEVLAWQRRNGVQKNPSKYSGDCEERKLALRFEKLLLRRDKALGTEPSRSQLSPSEVALVNSVPGVPLRGCSATASCSSTVAQQLPESAAIEGPRHAPANCVGGAESQNLLPCSVGIHHAADPTDINFEHCQELLERQQEHLETLKSILPDVKTRPSDSRIRELAERFKVPEQVDEQFLPLDLVFKSVQQQFHDEVCALQSKSRTMSSTNPAAKRARFATASTSSGASLAKRGRSVAQPAAGAKVVTQSNTGLGENRPVKRVSLAMENSSSGVAQSAAAEQFPSHAGCVGTRERSPDLNSEENRKTLLLQLKRPHYDAIKERRKLWEARPLFDGSYRQTIYDKLAVVGNAAILQSGAGTNDRVRIVEVRRYVPRGMSYPLEEMVVELGADLLPDVANTRGRREIYESLYGFQRCARGFVAMRLEWPNEASAPGTAEGGFNQEQDSGDPHPIVQSSGDPHPTQVSASSVDGHVDKPAALARMSRDVSEVASSGSAHSAASTEVLWLVLEESRYDAIASGRLRWEARPRDGTVREINNHLRDPYFDWTLAERGRSVVLQRGMGTGKYRKHAKTLAVKIAQVCIFSSARDWIRRSPMLEYGHADLVPNCTDPIKFYKDLYGGEACAHAFVAMRFERPDEAS